MPTKPPSDHLYAAFAASFPVIQGIATVSIVGIESLSEGLRVGFQVTVHDGPELVWMTEQELDFATLDPAEIITLATRVRERLATIDLESACITPSQLLAPPFVPLTLPNLPPDQLVPTITDALRSQALAGGFDARFDRLANWPLAPRTVYFLDLAHAMLGGQGFEVYLAQQDFEDILGVLEALDTAGCDRLALRMRQGIALCAEQGGAEFLVQVDEEWLEDEGRPFAEGESPSWSSIDSHEPGGTWWLVEHELAPALDTYVRGHIDELAHRLA